ncbi:hypothetical protein AAVH_05423 [Aphelenchoides avenae]|nr:hypothetical protein AAVH_05423 [Aphelenchus avenae]
MYDYTWLYIIIALVSFLPFFCIIGIICSVMYCGHKQQQAYMQQSPGPVFVVQAQTPGAAPESVVSATPSRATPQSYTPAFG